MGNDERLVWVDVETTGLDPNTCKLLQVAGVVTDMDLVQVSGEFEAVVRYSPDEVAAMRAAAPQVVRDMHDATGLWDRLSSDEAKPLEQVDAELLAFYSEFAPAKRQGRLAGNSVRLDLNFAERYLPASYAHLHYRSVDVSAVSYLLESWGISTEFEKAKTHDALSDIRESIAELRHDRAAIERLRQG